MKEKLMSQYKTDLPIYESMKKKIKEILEVVLADHGINYYLVEARVKSLESFEKKVTKKIIESSQEINMKEITDCVGLRIITFYEDEINNVVEILKNEFVVDEKNSIDKRQVGEKFGYSSVHLILTLREDRLKLPEYKNFAEISFEVQVRTQLQHVWAGISHELDYKAAQSLPEKIYRKFVRQAGLLEEVDSNFIEIRNQKREYLESMSGKEIIPIDENTLSDYLNNSDVNSEIIKEMLSKISSVENKVYDHVDLSTPIEKLKLVGILDIEKLDSEIIKYKEKIPEFFSKWLNHLDTKQYFKGLAGLPQEAVLFYLVLLILIEEKDEIGLYEEFANNFVNDFQNDPKRFMNNLQNFKKVWLVDKY